MMTCRRWATIILGMAIVLGACGRAGEEKTASVAPASTQATTNAPNAETASTATASTTVTSGDPDPFEMTAPPAPPDPNGPCVLGTKVGAGGKVADAVVSFARNDPIFLMVRPKASTSNLRIEIVAPMGERLQTFSGPPQPNYALKPLPRGRYRVNAFAGPDAIVCTDLAFEVR